PPRAFVVCGKGPSGIPRGWGWWRRPGLRGFGPAGLGGAFNFSNREGPKRSRLSYYRKLRSAANDFPPACGPGCVQGLGLHPTIKRHIFAKGFLLWGFLFLNS
ncbi:uncharacterized protein TM35_000181840, partial [Trypanosoma theileri]